jgi:hypothetical protein
MNLLFINVLNPRHGHGARDGDALIVSIEAKVAFPEKLKEMLDRS